LTDIFDNPVYDIAMSSVALSQDLSVNAITLRARAGLSQAALCERAGFSRDTLSRIERGEADPTLSVLQKLATGLGVDVADLFASAGSDEDEFDDAAILRLAADDAQRGQNVGARTLIAAIDEAAGFSPERYSKAGRPRSPR
jgi:transcriptional regulator with XRE-family HTH domain